MRSQALVLPKMISHSPDKMKVRYDVNTNKVKKRIRAASATLTSWLHEEDLPHHESWYGSRGFGRMVE